jgi:hypothetical protein
MLTLVATAKIRLTVKPGVAGDRKNGIAPVRPVVEDIPAGRLFIVKTEAEAEDLVSRGLARPFAGEFVLDDFARPAEEPVAENTPLVEMPVSVIEEKASEPEVVEQEKESVEPEAVGLAQASTLSVEEGPDVLAGVSDPSLEEKPSIEDLMG